MLFLEIFNRLGIFFRKCIGRLLKETQAGMTEYTDKSTKRSKPNYIYSIVSVAMVLFLVGSFGLIVLHAQKLIIVFKERLNIIVELKDSVLDTDIERFQSELDTVAYVKEGSPTFVSKEKAADLMREEFGEDFLQLELPNPFFDVITFNVKAKYMEQDSLTSIKQQLLERDIVQGVNYQERLTENIAQNIRRIGLIALAVSGFFILIAITLIHNTIRLALYSNRFLIKNMQLVGASWDFISRPYINKAIWHGIISSIVAILVLSGLMYWLWQNLPEIREFQDFLGYGALAVLLVVLGILINAISTYFVVNKYLKMRIDDLY